MAMKPLPSSPSSRASPRSIGLVCAAPVAATLSSRFLNSYSSACRTLRYGHHDRPAVAASATTAKRTVAKTVRCRWEVLQRGGSALGCGPQDRPARAHLSRVPGGSACSALLPQLAESTHQAHEA